MLSAVKQTNEKFSPTELIISIDTGHIDWSHDELCLAHTRSMDWLFRDRTRRSGLQSVPANGRKGRRGEYFLQPFDQL